MTTVHRHRVGRVSHRSSSALRLGRIPGGKRMRSDAAAQYTRMYAAARRAGVRLGAVSGYRSRAEQARLYQRYLRGGNLAARPGRSNHERGLAVDIAVGGTHSRTLRSHAHEFGFRRTVSSEPWHWEYRR